MNRNEILEVESHGTLTQFLIWNSFRYTHSAWLKGATATAFILIIYFGCLITASLRHFLQNTYFPHRNCLLNNQMYVEFCLRLLGFGHSNLTPLPIYSPENLSDEVQKVLQRWNKPYSYMSTSFSLFAQLHCWNTWWWCTDSSRDFRYFCCSKYFTVYILWCEAFLTQWAWGSNSLRRKMYNLQLLNSCLLE